MTALAALLIISCGSQDEAGNGGAQGNAPAPSESADEAAAEGGGESGGAVAMVSMAPGEYETRIETLRFNMVGGPGLPGGMTPPVPPPMTVRSCLTPEEAARPRADFFGGGAQAGCSYEDFSMSGGRIQGTMTCASRGATMRITMNGQFTAEGYQMEQESRVESGGMTTETASRITSRRIGDCPAR